MREWSNEELIKLYKMGDESAFNEYYEKNMGLFKSLIKKYSNYHSIDDEQKWGILNESIVATINYFDEEKGKKFNTVLGLIFEGALKREIISNNREKRNPKGFDDKCNLDIYHEDVYFQNEFISNKLINKALEKCNAKHRDFILPILLGNCTYKQACEQIGTCRQHLVYSINRFKMYMRNYLAEEVM